MLRETMIFMMEQIEEFIGWKGDFENSSLLENDDDAPYKSESFAILNYCMDNYKDEKIGRASCRERVYVLV